MTPITFNEYTLPQTLLEPPIAPPHRYGKQTWRRNWSILYISLNWTGRHKGKYEDLSRWVASIDRQPRLSRQRIEAINKQTLWALRNNLNLDLGKIEEFTSTR